MIKKLIGLILLICLLYGLFIVVREHSSVLIEKKQQGTDRSLEYTDF